jgi:hypothetical protein
MAITKKIAIDGIEVPFRASATVPRLYRSKFRRDIFNDLIKLREAVKESIDENEEKAAESEDSESSEATPPDTDKNEIKFSSLDIDCLEMFENISFIMAKHADPENVPDTPDEWLEQFSVFSIYFVLPQLLELWNLNIETQAEAKKNIARLTAK